MITSKMYKLAKLIKCVEETQTNMGLIVTENGLAVGVEAYTIDQETGDLVLAADGTYETDEITFVIEGGIVKEITEKTAEPVEEKPTTEEEEMVEEPVEEKTTEEETVEEDEKDKKIAELEAKIAELEAIIAEYKEKETQTENTVEEDMKEEKFEKQLTPQERRREQIMNALEKTK